MLSRREKLLRHIIPATQVGVEIGALDKPVVTREMGKIHYVDHASTAELREKYAQMDTVDTSKIVDVNHVWGAERLSDLLKDEDPFDYVIASHVVEHVPDLIGWFSEIRAILKPGGILSLAVPDKRQCFDYHRPLTRFPEVAEAYLQGFRKPSVRQILDHGSSLVAYKGQTAWSGWVFNPLKLTPLSSSEAMWNVAQAAMTSEDYCDVHCWVFTPQSFFQLLSEIAAAGLLKFEMASFFQTAGHEFFVSLRATDTANPAEFDHFAEVSLQKLPYFYQQVYGTARRELGHVKRKLEAMIHNDQR